MELNSYTITSEPEWLIMIVTVQQVIAHAYEPLELLVRMICSIAHKRIHALSNQAQNGQRDQVNSFLEAMGHRTGCELACSCFPFELASEHSPNVDSVEQKKKKLSYFGAFNALSAGVVGI